MSISKRHHSGDGPLVSPEELKQTRIFVSFFSLKKEKEAKNQSETIEFNYISKTKDLSLLLHKITQNMKAIEKKKQPLNKLLLQGKKMRIINLPNIRL